MESSKCETVFKAVILCSLKQKHIFGSSTVKHCSAFVHFMRNIVQDSLGFQAANCKQMRIIWAWNVIKLIICASMWWSPSIYSIIKPLKVQTELWSSRLQWRWFVFLVCIVFAWQWCETLFGSKKSTAKHCLAFEQCFAFADDYPIVLSKSRTIFFFSSWSVRLWTSRHFRQRHPSKKHKLKASIRLLNQW